MGNNWKDVCLGDISTIRRGSSPRPIVNFITDKGMPWVKIADATGSGSKFINETGQFLKEEGICKSVIVNKGDLILSNSGTAGLPKFMGITACIHDGWQVFKDLNGITSEFLYYSLINIRSSLLHNAYDSTMKNLTLDMVRDARIRLPSIYEQENITKILCDLDNKIELNQQTNQTLEQMAQTLFKSWFVDFDLVFDNLLAKVDFDLTKLPSDFPEVLLKRAEKRLEQSGQLSTVINQSKTGKPTQTATPLPHPEFPSEFEYNEQLGWIPKGWECKQLDDLVEIASSKRVFAKDYVEYGVPFYRGKEITELSQGKEVKTEIFITEDKYQELKLKAGAPKAGDILITSVGTIGNAYLVGQEDKFYFKDGNLTWVKEYKGLSIAHFLIEWLKNSLGKNAIENIKIGTTQQAITIKSLNKIKLIVPTNNISELFEAYAEKSHRKLVSNNNQNSSLSRLRDTLLPKLISGELQIPDAIENNGK